MPFSSAFGSVPRTPANADVPIPLAYVGGDGRESRTLEQAHLVLGCEGIGYRDPDYYATAVYSTLFGGGMSSRLFQRIREERGLVYGIHCFNAAYADGGLFGIYAGTGEDGLVRAHQHGGDWNAFPKFLKSGILDGSTVCTSCP